MARELVASKLPDLRQDALGLPPGVDPDRLRRIVRGVQEVWLVAFPVDPESLLPVARALDAYATTQTARAIQRLVGIDVSKGRKGSLTAAHMLWARENADLIKTMESRFFDQVANHVVHAVHEGRTDLAAVLSNRYGVATSNAKRIARTEVAKLNSQITEARQTEVGIRRYEWQTSEDERVRPEHAELNGTIRAWNDPHPTEGHPGTAINCRCVALPHFDDEG